MLTLIPRPRLILPHQARREIFLALNNISGVIANFDTSDPFAVRRAFDHATYAEIRLRAVADFIIAEQGD